MRSFKATSSLIVRLALFSITILFGLTDAAILVSTLRCLSALTNSVAAYCKQDGPVLDNFTNDSLANALSALVQRPALPIEHSILPSERKFV